MVKPFQGRTLFALLPIAAIFIIGAILLNSCGQGNPAGSQPGTTTATNPGAPNRNTPASTIPLAMTSPPSKVELSNASDTATISWNSYPGAATYNLYYSNTPDFASSSKITGISSPYVFPLADPHKSYFFFLTAGNGTAEQRISGDFISLYQNGERYSVVLSFEPIYKLLKQQQAASLSFPLMEKAYADILYWPSIVHADSSLTAYLNVATPFNQILLDIQCLHKEPDGSYTYEEIVGVNDWNFPANWGGKRLNGIYTYSAKYNGTKSSGWYGVYLGESTLGKFTDISTSITFKIDKPITGHYTFSGRGVNILQDRSYNRIITYPPGYLALNTGKEILRVNNSAVGGYWGEGFLMDFDLVGSGADLTVTPASATAYLHPTPTAVQFIAKDKSNNDVTNSAQWKIEPTATIPPVTIANINAGYATPLKPGEASVTATLLDGAGNVTASGGALLEVMCRNYTQYRQNSSSWKDVPFADHKNAGALNPNMGVFEFSIGGKGCLLTSEAMALTSTGKIVDPGQLNTYLNTVKHGWLSGREVNINKLLSNVYAGSNIIDAYPIWVAATSSSDIIPAIDACNLVIIRVSGKTGAFPEHYVMATKRKDNTIYIYDPWWYYYRGDSFIQMDALEKRYNIIAYKLLITSQ